MLVGVAGTDEVSSIVVLLQPPVGDAGGSEVVTEKELISSE